MAHQPKSRALLSSICQQFKPLCAYVFSYGQDIASGYVPVYDFTNASFDHGVGGRALANTDTSASHILMPTDSYMSTSGVTIFIHNQKRDTTTRTAVSIGNSVGATTARLALQLPYGGSCVWDYGDIFSGGRVLITNPTFGNDYWCATAGPRGLELYQNGVLLVNNTTAASRTASGNALKLGSQAGELADLTNWYSVVILDKQVPDWFALRATRDYYGSLFASNTEIYDVASSSGTFGSADLSTAGAATATLVGADRKSADLSATGAAVGTLATANSITANLSTAGSAVGTLATANRITADLSTTGVAVGTLEITDGNVTGQAALSAAGAAVGTLDTANRIDAALSATGAAVGTLAGEAVSGTVTADLSAAGAGTGTLTGASIVAAVLSAAGAAVGTLATGEEAADTAYLTWGAQARRRRIELEDEEEELLQMVATLAPMLLNRKGMRL